MGINLGAAIVAPWSAVTFGEKGELAAASQRPVSGCWPTDPVSSCCARVGGRPARRGNRSRGSVATWRSWQCGLDSGLWLLSSERPVSIDRARAGRAGRPNGSFSAGVLFCRGVVLFGGLSGVEKEAVGVIAISCLLGVVWCGFENRRGRHSTCSRSGILDRQCRMVMPAAGSNGGAGSSSSPGSVVAGTRQLHAARSSLPAKFAFGLAPGGRGSGDGVGCETGWNRFGLAHVVDLHIPHLTRWLNRACQPGRIKLGDEAGAGPLDGSDDGRVVSGDIPGQPGGGAIAGEVSDESTCSDARRDSCKSA